MVIVSPYSIGLHAKRPPEINLFYLLINKNEKQMYQNPHNITHVMKT